VAQGARARQMAFDFIADAQIGSHSSAEVASASPEPISF
jgi:hypothetical protein